MKGSESKPLGDVVLMPILKEIGALAKALWVPSEQDREYSSASTETPEGFYCINYKAKQYLSVKEGLNRW